MQEWCQGKGDPCILCSTQRARALLLHPSAGRAEHLVTCSTPWPKDMTNLFVSIRLVAKTKNSPNALLLVDVG